jgi:hypothetical protein
MNQRSYGSDYIWLAISEFYFNNAFFLPLMFFTLQKMASCPASTFMILCFSRLGVRLVSPTGVEFCGHFFGRRFSLPVGAESPVDVFLTPFFLSTPGVSFIYVFLSVVVHL